MQPWNCGNYVAKTWSSSIMGHQISSTMAKLMQDAIKMLSSFIALLLQFHRNASYSVTLLCLIYNMKLSKHYSKVNLDGHLEMWCGSSVDIAWPMMVGTTNCANSSNLVKMKLVKDLNKLGVTHMVVKTFCTPMLKSTNCPPPSSNFVGVKNSRVLTHVIVALMFGINLIKEVLVAIWGAWIKTRCNKLHK